MWWWGRPASPPERASSRHTGLCWSPREHHSLAQCSLQWSRPVPPQTPRHWGVHRIRAVWRRPSHPCWLQFESALTILVCPHLPGPDVALDEQELPVDGGEEVVHNDIHPGSVLIKPLHFKVRPPLHSSLNLTSKSWTKLLTFICTQDIIFCYGYLWRKSGKKITFFTCSTMWWGKHTWHSNSHLIRSHFWNWLGCENGYNQLSNVKYIRLGTIQENNLNTRGMSHWHTSHYLHKNSIQYKSATLHQSWWQELSWPASLQVNHTADLHHSTLTLKEFTIAYWCFIVIKQKCVHIK